MFIRICMYHFFFYSHACAQPHKYIFMDIGSYSFICTMIMISHAYICIFKHLAILFSLPKTIFFPPPTVFPNTILLRLYSGAMQAPLRRH